MKKLLQNKKAIISLAVALIIAASGITYAWFTSNAAVSASVGMGALKVTARMFEEYSEDATGDVIRVYPQAAGYSVPDPLAYTATESWFEPGMYYQPGQEGIVAFEVANPNPDGDALSFTVKLDGLDGEVQIWSDVNGDKLPAPIIYDNIAKLLVDYPGAVQQDTYGGITEPNTYFYVDAVTGDYIGSISWFFDENALPQLDYYVMMTPGMQLDYATQIAYDGDAMGNQFQRAKFLFDSSFVATQTLDDAIQAKWPGVKLIAAGAFQLVPLSQGGSVSTQSVGNVLRNSQFANFTIEDALRYAFPERYR